MDGRSELNRAVRRVRQAARNAVSRCCVRSFAKHRFYRGVPVHPEWRDDVGSFVRYLLTLPGWSDPDTKLARVVKLLGYVPGNLQWVSTRRKSSSM